MSKINKSSNVTVVIPCYNDGEYILKAIESITNQTLKADKIIIVDDGSDLKTKNILNTIKSKNIDIVFQENQGVSKARNKGISLVTTLYVLNLDADDFFEETFIEKAVAILNNNLKIGVVGSFYRQFNDKNNTSIIIKPIGGSVKNFLLKNNGMASSMFRKQCWDEVNGYDEKMVEGYEDWDFWISVLSNNWEMFIIEEVLFNYRIKELSRDKIALKSHDFDLKRYIFYKHENVFKNNFDKYSVDLLKENCMLKKNRILDKSLDYKIGNFILKPFRMLKIIK